MKKILIFSSYTGGGHMSLAESIRDLVEDRYEVLIVDPQPRILHFHYRMVSRHVPWLWNTEYKLSDGQRRARFVHEISKPTLAIPILRALRNFKPDVIISTYCIVTSEVISIMDLLQDQRPFAMLFSDPDNVHHCWLTEKRTQAIFAPTQETFDQALRAGFDPKLVHFTGWPVRKQFYHQQTDTRDQTLDKLGLKKNLFTIFLQGGAEGGTRVAQTVENILKIKDIQIILATGTNRRLYRYFQTHKNVYPLPFTRDIAKYMAASDIVMGKAGPNMIFESITLGKPFVATAYMPGQEELNLEFIKRYGLGWIALNRNEQTKLIETLVTYPDKVKEKLTSVDHYRRKNLQAMETIPTLIDLLALQRENYVL